MLSGGRDNIIRVWDMDAWVCRRTLAGHRDDVMCIAGLGLGPPAGSPADPSQPRDIKCSQVLLSYHLVFTDTKASPCQFTSTLFIYSFQLIC